MATILLDVNVLLAILDRTQPRHPIAEARLQSALASRSEILIPQEVALACIRLLANPHVVPHPVTPQSAYNAMEPLLQRSEVRLLAPNDDSWRQFGSLLAKVNGFRLVHDAHLAALALANNCHLVTFDRDFLRFEDLDVEILTV